MKQLKALILISCFLFILNCKTTPPLQFQESKQDQTSLLVTGSKSSTINAERVDIHEEYSDYINMNEETFVNLLNTNSDKLSLIEGIWSNERNTYKIGIQKAGEKGKYFAFVLNSEEPTINKGTIIAEFYETRYEYIYSTDYYLKDKTRIVTKTYLDDHGMLLIFLEKWGIEDLAFFRNPLIEETTKEEKISDVKQSLAKENKTGNDDYYVQVSASKNHNDAQKILVKIKKYYPETYIAVHNNYSKIRIPGVLTKKQGAIVSKDIEKKFNLKPMLVLNKR